MRTRKKEQHLFRKKFLCRQFHQRYLCAVFCTKSLFLVTFWLCQKKFVQKSMRKTLMKLTPAVNFTNILRTAFALVEIPKAQELSQVIQYLFTLLGTTSVKAVRRTLMILTPGRINEIHKTS